MQSRRAGLALGAVAVVVAVVLFIVLSGGDSDDASTKSEAPTEIAVKNGAPVGGEEDMGPVVVDEAVRRVESPAAPAVVGGRLVQDGIAPCRRDRECRAQAG